MLYRAGKKKGIFSFSVLLLTALCGSVFAGGAGTVLRITGYGAPLGTTQDGTLDPLKTYELLYFNLQHQIFETLVALDLDTQTLTPALAESWKQIDEKTIRFYLRRGVRFHNGEPFTAEAVKFSLDLMQDPRNRFAGRYLLDSIAGTHIIDDFTLDITLRYQDVLVLRKLAAIGFILPPGYYRKVGNAYFTRYPMGTGPLRFFYVERKGDELQSIHLVANEDYWRTLRPSFKELAYLFIPGEQQWDALAAGQVDMVITQYAGFEDAVRMNPSIRVTAQPSLRHSACILNVDKPGPLADLRVRTALQHCVSRREIIAQALKGYGRPLYGTVPSGSLADVPNEPLYREDINAARQLLHAAGFTEGLRLKVMASNTINAMNVVKVLEQQLQQAGIALEVHFLNRNEILQEVVTPKLQGVFTPSDYDLWVVTGWPNIFGTGTNFYFMYLHSRGMFNFGIHLNKQSRVDQLYEHAVASRDADEFKQRLRDLDHYVLTQSLVVPLYQVEVLYGTRSGVTYDPGLNDLPHRFWNCTIRPEQ